MFYIFRIDGKDADATTCISEARDIFERFNHVACLELVSTELRTLTVTYNYKCL